MPTVWDETIVLGPSEIGTIAAFARRSKATWFIAIMNGDTVRKIEIPLDFLKDGNYKMEAYQDQSAKKVISTVKKNDMIPIRLRPSGGYIAKIEMIQ
jgi:alpha-glucosidase